MKLWLSLIPFTKLLSSKQEDRSSCNEVTSKCVIKSSTHKLFAFPLRVVGHSHSYHAQNSRCKLINTPNLTGHHFHTLSTCYLLFATVNATRGKKNLNPLSWSPPTKCSLPNCIPYAPFSWCIACLPILESVKGCRFWIQTRWNPVNWTRWWKGFAWGRLASARGWRRRKRWWIRRAIGGRCWCDRDTLVMTLWEEIWCRVIGPELRIITARAPASPILTAEVARLSRDAPGAISRPQIMKW